MSAFFQSFHYHCTRLRTLSRPFLYNIPFVQSFSATWFPSHLSPATPRGLCLHLFCFFFLVCWFLYLLCSLVSCILQPGAEKKWIRGERNFYHVLKFFCKSHSDFRRMKNCKLSDYWMRLVFPQIHHPLILFSHSSIKKNTNNPMLKDRFSSKKTSLSRKRKNATWFTLFELKMLDIAESNLLHKFDMK